MNSFHPPMKTIELTGAAAERTADEAWRRLENAADQPNDPMRLFTLCTVTPESAPAARVMLLRGAEPGARRLWCHSTRHSGKIAELRANPAFTAVAYDPLHRIQIRLSGTARVHEVDATTVQHFEQALLARRSGQTPDCAVPDPLWPASVELLIDRAKRDSWKEFVVIEMLVATIDWTQVSENRVTHAFIDVAGER